MADIEEEIEKLFRCQFHWCKSRESHRKHHVPIVAEFCRKLVVDHEQLRVDRDALFAKVAGLEQELGERSQALAYCEDELKKRNHELATERADNADLSEGIDGMIQDREYFEDLAKRERAERDEVWNKVMDVVKPPNDCWFCNDIKDHGEPHEGDVCSDCLERARLTGQLEAAQAESERKEGEKSKE